MKPTEISRICTQGQWRARMEQLVDADSSASEVRALELLGRSHGWDQPTKRKATPKPIPTDPIERMREQLTDIRVNRATAERDGSHVAARGYLADELTLSAQLDAAVEARRKSEDASKDGPAILEAFRQDLLKLPLRLRKEIRRIALEEVGDDV